MKLLIWAWTLFYIALPLHAEAGGAVDSGAADATLTAPERASLLPKAKLGLTHYFDSRQYETLAVFSQV